MSASAPLICLLTPGHVASTPRLVKEADALVDAGYRVHVVAGRHFEAADPLDDDILGSARWQCTRIDYRGGAGALVRKILRRLSRRLVVRPSLATLGIAARASHAESLHMGAVASRLSARLYVGHCLPALPAAALAATRAHGAYGFDAEDFHDAETQEACVNLVERSIVARLQGGLLKGCGHLTASSPLIGRMYSEIYGVQPRIVLNVFPRSHAPDSPVEPGPITADRPAVAYWFSQTIGPGRGLEGAIHALARVRTPIEIHLRGIPAPGYPEHLTAVARQVGLKRPVRILPPGPPTEMARLAASADLGLSTEERSPLNRDICLTNKVFVYLLAGIPQLLSSTAAQQALAPSLGEAALLADMGDSVAVAARIDGLLSDPVRTSSARMAARELSQRRYCWDVEKSVFLGSIGEIAPLE